MAGYDGLDPQLASALRSLIAESGGGIFITSGFRSPQQQQALWQQALKKYGDPEIADNWVARPGTSHHEMGFAVDLGFNNAAAREWAHRNAARFGLRFPMSHEPWHIELTGQRSQADRRAYTNNPTTGINPVDEYGDEMAGEDPFDPGAQARRLFDLISSGAPTEIAASPKPEITGAPGLEESLVKP